MLTRSADQRVVSVFLFAHQDDECGVYDQIYLARRQGRRPVCIYATTGVQAGQLPTQRNAESTRVLTSLGVDAQDIIFAGEQLAIADGALIDHLSRLADWLKEWILRQPEINAIFVPAWEGGHPDHDGLHAVAVHIGEASALLDQTYQYSLYNGYRCMRPWFRLFSPLKDNGDVQYHKIPWRRRWAYVRCVLGYPSQWRTWIGLFPFFALHLMFRGWEAFQRVNVARLCDRPHAGILYYEMRKFSSWTHMQQALQQWSATRPEGVEK